MYKPRYLEKKKRKREKQLNVGTVTVTRKVNGEKFTDICVGGKNISAAIIPANQLSGIMCSREKKENSNV